MRIIFLFILFFHTAVYAEHFCAPKIFAPFHSVPADEITYLPNYGCLNTLQLAGNLPVTEPFVQAPSNQSSLFYWFVGSAHNSSKTPIVVWLNGGPGASSFYGFFTENGPYGIDSKGWLYERNFSWAKKVNYLMIDNPAGVGFSYADPHDPVRTEQQASDQLYHALQNFFHRYPEFKHNPLYLTGESYAGKYIAELAVIIHQNDPSIPLHGIMVGDGWVDPAVQQASVPDYAYYHGLIDTATYQQARQLYQNCADALHKGTAYLAQANEVCMKVDDFVMSHCALNRHDIRELSEIDYAPIARYLNNPVVRDALHVDQRVKSFTLFNDSVSKNLAAEIQKSDVTLYDALLNADIPVLIFNGLEDASDSNFLGTTLWLAKLTGKHNKNFSQAPTCVWYDAHHQVAGFVRSDGILTQIKMRNAGHMAPMDQPQNTLDMLERFIQQRSFC